MATDPKLQFKCLSCKENISFSAIDSNYYSNPIVCDNCQKKYAFNENIINQLKKFEALCQQIQQSKDILANTAVSVDVNSHNIRVPYRLLLTRFNSIIKLNIGGKPLEIAFRTEPLKDIA